ncbi:MAG: hypothetical protein COA44_12505 [Arcobacter sp.]|nr:MAG: hypothetical protein COA44_12505 [Arcobacter sp.]
MARRPRLDLAGFHHVLNRGVEKRKIFIDEDDYKYFLELMCVGCLQNDINVHSYSLLSNHYHILIETKRDNLSKFMRSLNAHYASYFNRKYKRVGHLWQGRFKSWYVNDEAYLYTLIKYIEFNPIEAKMVKMLRDYKFSSYNSFLDKGKPLSCLENSLMFKNYETIKERKEFFEMDYDKDDLKMITKASNSIVSPLNKKEPSLKKLYKLLENFETKKERNIKIKESIVLGYSQSQVAKVLGLSQPAIASILKK